jgi:lysophospholipase L1-like esterase
MRSWFPALAALLALALPAAAAAAPLVLGIAGDSTASHYPPASVQRGWGEFMQRYFDDTVVVANLAQSGRSTKTFLKEGWWDKLIKRKPDIVLIQFGHNDSHSPDHPEHTDPEGEYKTILIRFVQEARAAGADPVLVTPVQRRTATDSLIPYAQATIEVATAYQVKLIDLHALSGELYARLGKEGTAALEKPGDRTHFNAYGAGQIADVVLRALLLVEPQLRSHLKAVPAQP